MATFFFELWRWYYSILFEGLRNGETTFMRGDQQSSFHGVSSYPKHRKRSASNTAHYRQNPRKMVAHSKAVIKWNYFRIYQAWHLTPPFHKEGGGNLN